MLLVECRKPSKSEQDVLEQLSQMDGIAVVGYVIETSNQERETDIIWLSPQRATVIEVKGDPVGSPVGRLTPNLNSPWLVDGKEVSFFGSTLPHLQARTSAQILSAFFREKELSQFPFIQSAVAVSSRHLHMDSYLMAGQTLVSTTGHFAEGIRSLRNKSVKMSTAVEMLKLMDLGPKSPTLEAIVREWVSYLPPSSKERASRAAARRRAQMRKSVSDKVSIFIIIFLATFFIYTMFHYTHF